MTLLLSRFSPRLCISAVSFALFFTCVLAAEDNPESPGPLVQKLRSEEFDTRREAAAKLIAMGETARGALEQAAASEDLELRQAAAALLTKLDKSTVTVMAFDRDGKPASGAEAEVKIFPANPNGVNWNEQKSENVTLKTDGSARLPDQPPGMIGLQFTWKKWAPARDQTYYWNLQLERGNTPFLMTLTHGGTVNFAVEDAEGKPLKDATVVFYSNRKFEPELLDMQLTASENWDRNSLSASTDATGKGKYEGLADGSYQCVIKASDFRSAVGPSFRIHEGEVVDLPSVKLTPRNAGKIQFVVKKADGSPLKKTRVGVNVEYQYEGPRAVELQRIYRQLKTQLNMQRQNDWPETDEEGKITVEDQRPGKYRVSIASNGDTAWEPAEATVAAGQTAELGALKVVNGGIIKGKILDSKNKGMQYCTVYAIPEEEAIDYDDGEPVIDWRFMYQQFNGRSAVQTQADGTYEAKNLRPGRYALSVQTRTGQPLVIYGVIVESGKTVNAPDAATPGNVATGNTQTLKGTVLLPDGKPAAGANIGVVSGFSRWGRNCDDKGNFEIQVNDQMMPTRLVIKAAECKPYGVDLSAPGTKLGEIKVTLEKQEYGDLRMKIVDEAGQPLSGVTVRPAQKAQRQVYYYRATQTDLKAVSSREGIARFSGLAAGQRSLQFDKDGYFCAGEVKAAVLPNKESELTVTMKKGFTVKGKIELPPGSDLDHSAVYLADAKSRMMSVDKTGQFQFGGLAPGDYFFSPICPGLIGQGRQKISLKPDGTFSVDGDQIPDTELKLKMDRPAGAAIMLGPDFSGYQASLVPKGSWDPSAVQDAYVWYQSVQGSVDATGRAEFWGTTQNEYDLVLNPSQMPYANYRYYNNATKKASATLVLGAVKTQTLKTTADMKTLAPTEFKLEAATGSLNGRLICEPNVGQANINYGSLMLKIVGQKAYTTVNYSYPSEFYNQGQRVPIILGTPPAGMKTGELGNFSVQGLPPGEYKIYADITPYRYSQNGYVAQEKIKPNTTPIATCTVKAGERVNLGTVKYTLPASVVSEMKNSSEAALETEPEDRVQVFQP
jgi:hypothetical protein